MESTKKKINDAVLYSCGSFSMIRRVIAITPDGRAILERPHGEVDVEKKLGDWPVVGQFIKGWFSWRFIPHD